MSNTLNHSQAWSARRGLRARALSAVRRLHEWVTALVGTVLFAGEPMAVVWDDPPTPGLDHETAGSASHRVGRRRTSRIRLRVHTPSNGGAPLVVPTGSVRPSTRRTQR